MKKLLLLLFVALSIVGKAQLMVSQTKSHYVATPGIHLKINLGGDPNSNPAPPSVPSDWINVWGDPNPFETSGTIDYTTSDGAQSNANYSTWNDLGGSGIGIRALNNAAGISQQWGLSGGTASSATLGTTTGANSGVYPDNVMLSYWFGGNLIGEDNIVEFYGCPDYTYTVKVFGARATTGSRITEYNVNGGTGQTLQTVNNTANVITFTDVTPSSGIIQIHVKYNNNFSYLNAIELIQTSDVGGGEPEPEPDPDLIPRSYTNGHNWTGSWGGWVYEPEHLEGDKKPLTIGLHGSYGGTTEAEVNKEFIQFYINAGDSPDRYFCAMQGDDGVTTWRPDYIFAMYMYMFDNYGSEIDITQVSVAGLSLGGAGIFRAMESSDTWKHYLAGHSAFQSEITGRIPIYNDGADYVLGKDLYACIMGSSGAIVTGYDYSVLDSVGIFYIHGQDDGTLPITNYTKLLQNVSAQTMTNAPQAFIIEAGPHNVWNTHFANRKNKTNSAGDLVGGTAPWDWHEWASKFNIIDSIEARQHYEFANTTHNWTNQYLDYLEALRLTNALASSTQKTLLLSKLATLRATMDDVYIIDFGESGTTTSGNVNNLSAFNDTNGLTNLIDDTGSASAYDITVNQNFGTDVNGINLSTYLNFPAFGLPSSFYRDGAQVLTTITNGEIELSSLNDAHTYDIITFVGGVNTNFLNDEEINIEIGGDTQFLYTNHNAFKYTLHEGVSPTSGSILIHPDAPGSRNSNIIGLIIIDHP